LCFVRGSRDGASQPFVWLGAAGGPAGDFVRLLQTGRADRGAGSPISSSEILLRPRKGAILLKFLSRATTAGDDWFRDAGDRSELFPIRRFVSDEVFATRSGGWGASFALDGVDTECLTDEAQVALSAGLPGGQRLVPGNLVVYQIARERRGHMPALRHTESANPLVARTRERFYRLAKDGFPVDFYKLAG
jgi:hypothetical protein